MQKIKINLLYSTDTMAADDLAPKSVWQFQYYLSDKPRPLQNVYIMLYCHVFVQKNITQSLLMTLQGTILFIVITVPTSLSMHTYEPYNNSHNTALSLGVLQPS